MAERERLTIAALKGRDLRDVHPVVWPGTGKTVGLMELRCGELLSSYFAARERFGKAGFEAIDEAAREAFDAEFEAQCCYRMLVDPDARVAKYRVFKDADETSSRLDPNERAFFWAEHARFAAARAATWSAVKAGETEDAEGPPPAGTTQMSGTDSRPADALLEDVE